MNQKTLDILDAALRQGQTHYVTAPAVDRVQFYRREFLCDPTNWTQLYAAIGQHTFNWQEFRFRDAVTNNDIDTRIQIVHRSRLAAPLSATRFPSE
jgi:hypothetical protein